MVRIPSRPLLLGAGVLSAALLGLSGTGTLASITAQVTNSPTTNRVGLGRLVMELRSAGVQPCRSSDSSDNASTCTTVLPLSGNTNLIPGQPVQTTVTAANLGSVTPSSFVLTPGDCTPTGDVTGTTTQAAKDDICSKVQVTVVTDDGATTTYSAADLKQHPRAIAPPAAGQTTDVQFRVTTPGTLSNAYQGLGIAMPMTWTFQQ